MTHLDYFLRDTLKCHFELCFKTRIEVFVLTRLCFIVIQHISLEIQYKGQHSRTYQLKPLRWLNHAPPRVNSLNDQVK